MPVFLPTLWCKLKTLCVLILGIRRKGVHYQFGINFIEFKQCEYDRCGGVWHKFATITVISGSYQLTSGFC